MDVMRAVLEVAVPEGFGLWPVAEADASGFLALGGGLSPAEVGTAVTALAACNRPADEDGEGDDPAPRPEPGTFLRGLLSYDEVFAAGGLRVVDPGTGVAFAPGCCDGLEEWRDWYRLVDGDGSLGFGHAPVSPLAERYGDTLRLTVDAERDDSPVIELPAQALRGMLAGVERDLTAFLDLAVAWAAVHTPGLDRAVVAALARALDVPPPPLGT